MKSTYQNRWREQVPGRNHRAGPCRPVSRGEVMRRAPTQIASGYGTAEAIAQRCFQEAGGNLDRAATLIRTYVAGKPGQAAAAFALAKMFSAADGTVIPTKVN
jgi:hypothetical protein